jgi:hypothetical protein
MKRFALLFAAAAIAAAADKPRDSEVKAFHLQWQDLDRLAHGHRADLVLPNGTVLGGKVLAVESDALVLDLKTTSDKHAWPKGRASIPRAQVSHVRITKVKSTWRGVGTAIGLTIGTMVAIPLILYNDSSEARLALSTGLAFGLPAAAGYGLGWGADHRRTEIDVEGSAPPQR